MLEDGQSVNGEFEGDITGRLYAFSATEGNIVTISMTQITPELDPYLVLMGARGEVLTDDDDSGDLEFSSRIQNFVIPEDGSYFVLASAYAYLDNRFIEAEEAEPPAEATGILHYHQWH